MNCPKCGAFVAADDGFCRQCGWRLNAQAKPRVGMGAKMATVCAAVAVIFVGLISIAFWAMNSSQTASEDSAPKDGVIVGKTGCAESEGDEARLLLALKRDDAAATVGLLSHGDAVVLEAGTGVRIIITDDSLVRVRVTSGTYTGKHCWAPADAVR